MEKGHTLTNFAHLGELLLAPHGLQVGLEFPDHTEIGDDATCACESEEVDEQVMPKVGAVEGGNTVPEINLEDMETEDVAALMPAPRHWLKCFAGLPTQSLCLSLLKGSIIRTSCPEDSRVTL